MNFKPCQKCGSHRIIGPRYVQGPVCGGHLKYTCSECGWFWYEATKDTPRQRKHWTEEAEP